MYHSEFLGKGGMPERARKRSESTFEAWLQGRVFWSGNRDGMDHGCKCSRERSGKLAQLVQVCTVRCDGGAACTRGRTGTRSWLNHRMKARSGRETVSDDAL